MFECPNRSEMACAQLILFCKGLQQRNKFIPLFINEYVFSPSRSKMSLDSIAYLLTMVAADKVRSPALLKRSPVRDRSMM
jgi:hypothetical protein